MSSTPHNIPDKKTADAVTTVKFLKLVALDDRTNLCEIGYEQGLDEATVDKILNKYKYIVLADLQTGDYPKRTIGIFSNASEPFLPEQEKLVEEELENLKFILKFKKGKKKVISETDRTFNDNMSYEPTTRQPYNNMGAPPMINQGQGQQQYPHIPNSIINHNRLTHINNNSTNNNHKGTTLNDDVSLMRMLLMNNFDPQASLN